MELRVLKPRGRRTAVVEVWESDRLIAEVFAGHDGVRRFHFSTRTAAWDRIGTH